MTTDRELSSPHAYLKLVLVLTAASLFLMALGYAPTRRLAGAGTESAMFVGVAISWMACAVAALPLVGMSRSAAPHMRLTLSIGLRLFFVAALTGSILLSGWLATAPLLIWVGVSYFVLLILDAGFAVARLGGIRGFSPTAAAGADPSRGDIT